MSIKLLKTLALSTLILTSSAFSADLLEEGQKILKERYISTGVTQLDEVRAPIRSSFEAANKIYVQFQEKSKGFKQYNQFLAFSQGKDEAEVKAQFDSLEIKSQEKILAASEANEGIVNSIGELIVELVAQQLLFTQIDSTTALAGLSMWDMPSALEGVANTGSEIDFILKSVGEIHRINKQLNTFKTAT